MSTQNGLLPLTPSVSVADDEPRTVQLFTEEGAQIVDALSSDTARTIVGILKEEPATTTDIAEQVEVTLQNVHHHMKQLQDAGIVRVVETHYSSRGTEMDVFALDGAPLVLVCGDTDVDTDGATAVGQAAQDETPSTMTARSD